MTHLAFRYRINLIASGRVPIDLSTPYLFALEPGTQLQLFCLYNARNAQ